MTQNLISLDITDDLPKLDGLLDEMERMLDAFISLDAEQRRRLTKIGDRSESFCRQTLSILEQNRQALPPGFDLEELKRDLAAFDDLRPRLLRLQAVAAKWDDTHLALGSDIMMASYEGYALLKVFGKADHVTPLQDKMRASSRHRTPAPDTGVA